MYRKISSNERMTLHNSIEYLYLSFQFDEISCKITTNSDIRENYQDFDKGSAVCTAAVAGHC